MPETAAPRRVQGIVKATRLAVLAGLLGVVPALGGCVAEPAPGGNAAPDPVATGVISGVPSTSAPLETTQSSNKAPVYWIGRSKDSVFLYREFRDVPEQENPVTRALRAMMAEKPLDPDYFTPWQNPKQLATSITGKDVITVDVSEDAFNSNLDAEMAARAIQQLVYTATAAAASSGLIDAGQQIRVRILVDGHTDYMAFNHVQLGSLMTRATGLAAPVWIIDPQENVELPAGTVKVTGRSTALGAELEWQVLKADPNGNKAPFLNGKTAAAADPAQAGVFTLELDLPVGDYELRVVQDNSGGQQGSTDETRSFRVR